MCASLCIIFLHVSTYVLPLSFSYIAICVKRSPDKVGAGVRFGRAAAHACACGGALRCVQARARAGGMIGMKR
jgi:hypothetical protein